MTCATSGTAPLLLIIRGNSASGKTSTAREVRRRYGRGCALIEQDHLRRVVLREHDEAGGVAPAFITATARNALELGYHVILEGILSRARYEAALRALIAGHPGARHVFYLDVSFEETVRRHATKTDLPDVTEDHLRAWYAPGDVLGTPGETVLDESATFEHAVTTVLHDSGLARAAALTPCPAHCPRCASS